MKTNNIFAASACIASLAMATSLTSCSNDEMIVDEPQIRNEIRFNITSNRATRATQYGDANSIESFKVCAWVRSNAQTYSFGSSSTGNSYFKSTGETVNKTDNEWNFSDGQLRYWPNNNEVLDFYAWVDGGNSASFSWSENTNKRPMLSVKTETNAADMGDLLTADEFNKTCGTKSSTSQKSKVDINFSHALAQVNVSVKVENPKIQMQVAEIALVNINTEGDFYFDIPDADNKDDAEWKDCKTPASLIASVEKVGDDFPMVINGGDAVNLTGSNPFMVIPGTYNCADDATISNDVASTGNSFFRIKCKVWNVAEANGAKATSDLQIYGKNDVNDGYAYLYVPASFTWVKGTKYSYTISFGKGNAGLDSNGNPTLVMIDWNLDGFNAWADGNSTNEGNPIEISK